MFVVLWKYVFPSFKKHAQSQTQAAAEMRTTDGRQGTQGHGVEGRSILQGWRLVSPVPSSLHLQNGIEEIEFEEEGTHIVDRFKSEN